MLQILWQPPTIIGTPHRKIQNPSLIGFCFIGIFQNRDGQKFLPPPPVACNDRCRLLQIVWHPPTMIGALQRKNSILALLVCFL